MGVLWSSSVFSAREGTPPVVNHGIVPLTLVLYEGFEQVHKREFDSKGLSRQLEVSAAKIRLMLERVPMIFSELLMSDFKWRPF